MARKVKQTAQNVKFKGKRNYDQNVADGMFYYVVGQKVFPICRAEAAFHGAGIAITELAVQVMLDRVVYIRDCFGSRIADLKQEADYSPDKLIEHIKILSGAKRLLAVTLDEKGTELAGRRRTDQESNNILNRLFRLIDQNGVLLKGIKEMVDILDDHLNPQYEAHMRITEEILNLPENIRKSVSAGHDPDHNYSKQIQPLLKGKLNYLKNKANRIIKWLTSREEKLLEDWKSNSRELRSKKLGCRAVQKRRFIP